MEQEKILYFPKDFYLFNPGGTYVEAERKDNTVEVEAIPIDEFVKEKGLTKVDFIKLDVEGAEPEVIKGAEEVIREFKPDMAIAIYHELPHYWGIPLMILDIFPNYQLYFNYYSPLFDESVMYFINPRKSQ